MASPSAHQERTRPNLHAMDWRESIDLQLQFRKSIEQTPFEEICSFASGMFDKVDIYKSENIKLNLQCEQLQQQLLGIQQSLLAGGSDAAKTIISKLSNVTLGNDDPDSSSNSATVRNLNIQHASLLAEKSQLEKKILELQERLADVLKTNSDTVQKVVDLKTELEEKDRANRHLTSLIDHRDREIRELKEILDKLEAVHKTLSDEHLALSLMSKHQEKKLLDLTLERDKLSAIVLDSKRKEAERLNAENDRVLLMQRERAQREIEANVASSSRDQLARQAAGDRVALKLAAMAADNFEPIGDDEELRLFNLSSTIPTTQEFTFDAHDSVSAVKWYYCSSPRDNYLATGGQDRKVKLWKISDMSSTPIGDGLHGSNSSITSIDVDSDSILASSCDMATRVWSLSTQRLNLTLTGHSAKVNSAKFLGTPVKIASGSADRTLKLWDVNRGACVRTFFAASTCFDLVYGNHHIISCHFDKKLRGWDLDRQNENDCAWMVPLGDSKIIAVDISMDNTKVICCLRDNTLKCVDIRTREVIQTYSDEKFKTGEENWRVNFSNDGQYIACGSSDGSFFIWDVNTAKVEKVLKGHSNKVLAACWSPDGKRMVSIENGKKVSIWI